MHISCPQCPGFELDINEASPTAEDVGKLMEAQSAHQLSHVVVPEVTHIRKRINPNSRRGNGFYTLQLSVAENGSQTLCGSEPTTQDMGYGDTRHAKGLAYVSCETCKTIRTGA
jgi:hypothetical protein